MMVSGRNARLRAWFGLAGFMAFLLLAAFRPADAAEPLIVYGDENLPPYEFVRGGTPQGAGVDLLQAVAQRLGRPVQIHLRRWDQAQEAVLAGSGHALSTMARTATREATYDFTDETFRIAVSLFALAERSEDIRLSHLAGLKVGVTEKSLPKLYLSENHPEVELVVVEDYADGIRKVLRREIDAVAASTWAGAYFLSELNISGIGIVAPPLVERTTAIAVPKGNPELVADINEALRQLKADGTFDHIMDKWSAQRVYLVSQRDMSRVAWLAGGAGSVSLLVFGFVWALRRQRKALAVEMAERRRSEAALSESEALFKNLTDAQPGLVYVADSSGKATFVNAAVETYTGMAADKLLADGWVRAVHPEDAGAAWQRWSDAVTGGVEFQSEHRLRRRDGSYRWFLCRGKPIRERGAGHIVRWVGVCTDIDDSRRAAEALRASEEKYRTLFANMAEGFAIGELIYDAMGRPVDQRILEANEAFFRQTGLSRDILGQPFGQIVAQRPEQYWLDAYHAVVERGGSAWLENYNATTQRYYDLRAFRPAPGRFAIVFRDVTEFKRAQRAIQESERDLRQLIATLPGMVWICSPDGLIEFISQQWLDYTGTSLESQLGTGTFDAIHPDDRPGITEAWGQALAAVSPLHVEFRLRRHDGAYRWFKSHGTPVLEQDGQVVRWLGVVVDIDDLKRFESALEQERDRARGYLQVAGVMLLVLDADGRIETINRRGAEILGYDDESCLVGRNWFELAIPPELRDELTQYFRRMVAGDDRIAPVHDNPVMRADGTQRLIAWRNTVLRDEAGRVIGTLSSGEDVTDARRHQALLARDKAELERLVEERTGQLVQLQKMEAIGQLTGGVAHDFNNVLQALASCLFVLERHVPDGAPRTFFDAAQRSIESGARLTQSLLAFARRQMLAPEAVELSKLFDNIRPLLDRTLGGMISFSAEVAPGTPNALVDRAQLESAILNLAINARDAMPSGGELALRAGPVNVRAGERGHPAGLGAGDYVAVTVADTGTGMDEATLARVFEPFFTTKAFGKGSGLGLSMVHGMAAQSGGGVAIRSRPGQGTTVTLYLPCAAVASPESSAPAAGVVPGDGSMVLLVDDNDLMRDALQITLEGLGYRVLTAGSGEAALALLRENRRIDALVTDYAMPGMNGAALAREAARVLPGLPVLLITGYAEKLDDMKGIALLHKPFKTEELVERLAALLRAKSAHRTGIA